jgi:hypothetical protein
VRNLTSEPCLAWSPNSAIGEKETGLFPVTVGHGDRDS